MLATLVPLVPVVAPTHVEHPESVQALRLWAATRFVSEPAVYVTAADVEVEYVGTEIEDGTVGSVASFLTVSPEATHAEVLPALSSDCVQA